MIRRVLRACGLGAAVLALPLSLPAQKGIPEPRVGFELKPPKGWVELPAAGDRRATLRLFAGPRALADKGEGTHTPLLRVMFFKKEGDDTKDVVEDLPRQTPFRSLEDFVARGLGMKGAQKEAAKAGAFDGQRLTAKSDTRTVFGQTIALDDGEAALCFEVLTNQAEKVKKEFDATFASLAAVPRVAGTRLDPPWTGDNEWAKKDLAARNAARRKWADEVVAAVAKAPEAGFKVKKAKYWTVVSAAEAGFTSKAIAAAEVARAWCQQRFPDLTKDAPMPAVLRIFDSTDHLRAYLTTVVDQRDYDGGRRELLFVNDPDNGGSAGYGMLFRAVLWQVFDDVDDGVLPAMPRWFDNGWWEYMRSTHCDGKKIEFAPSDVEKGRLTYYPQNNLPVPPIWDLMQEHIQVSPADGANEKDWSYTPECARALRWFCQHDGQKAFDKPNLLSDYVRALGAAYAKVGADPTLDVAVVGITEAQQKELNKKHYVWRDSMLVAANNIAVGLQVDAWKAVNEKWLEFNKTFK